MPTLLAYKYNTVALRFFSQRIKNGRFDRESALNKMMDWSLKSKDFEVKNILDKSWSKCIMHILQGGWLLWVAMVPFFPEQFCWQTPKIHVLGGATFRALHKTKKKYS